MAKQNKKGKNELDIILEQLKKSYKSETSDSLEDDLLETESSEEDSELNEILSRIFQTEDSSESVESFSEEIDNSTQASDEENALSSEKQPDAVEDCNETSAADPEESTESDTPDNSDAEISNSDCIEYDNSNSAKSDGEVLDNNISNDEMSGNDNTDNTSVIDDSDEDNTETDGIVVAATEDDPVLDETTGTDELAEPFIDVEASEQVDNVINIMFSHKKPESSEYTENIDNGESEVDGLNETAEPYSDIEKIANDTDSIGTEATGIKELDNDVLSEDEDELSEVFFEDSEINSEFDEYFEEDEDEDEDEDDEVFDISVSNEDNDNDGDYVYLSSNSDNADYEEDDFAIEDEEYDVSDDEETSETDGAESFDGLQPEFSDVDLNDDDDNEIIEAENKPRFVLTQDQYINDPLQNAFPSFNLPGYNDADNDDSEMNDQLIDLSKINNISFDNNDISLLLKLGYDNEVKTKVGNLKTQEVVVEQENKFKPEKYKKPFGYCGKELYNNKEQFAKIREKYKSNKFACAVLLALVSILSLLILALDTFYLFFSDRVDFFPIAIVFEILFVALIILILHQKIISGVSKIIKFEADSSSLLSFLFITYIIYQAVALIMYRTIYPEVGENDLFLFGFCISLYAVLYLISDLLNCIREFSAFTLITTSDEIYVAEKQNYLVSSQKSNISKENNTYKIQKASMVSGYFKKTAARSGDKLNIIVLLGIIPILSLSVGCTVALICENILLGLAMMMMTVILCIPISTAFVTSIFDFVTSKWLKKYDSAFIGTESVDEYAAADTLIFRDTDAVSVSAYTEIRPGKGSEPNDPIEIAYQVFKTLGGPISNAFGAQSKCTDNAEHALVINEILDNGIDIYYDNSFNILIGDKYFMQTHKIKVKTDTNLSAAIKGIDRSVIYMAFNGTPKLGFIINSKINKSFLDITQALETACIKVMVETYEPQINKIYFEQNMGQNNASIDIIKPKLYESQRIERICNSGIVSSSNSISVAKSILLSRDIVSHKKAFKYINRLVMIGEIAMAVLLTVLLCFNKTSDIFSGIWENIVAVFYTIVILGVVPSIIKLITANRRNSAKDKQNGDKRQK